MGFDMDMTGEFEMIGGSMPLFLFLNVPMCEGL